MKAELLTSPFPKLFRTNYLIPSLLTDCFKVAFQVTTECELILGLHHTLLDTSMGNAS